MKTKSYLLIFVLIIILIFILGIRYGQNVEKTNKIVNYVLSITPSPTPTPVIPLTYKTYENKTCGLTFLIPNTLSIQTASSQSATFIENKTKALTIDCNKQSGIADLYNDPKTATGEVMFKNKKLAVKQTDSNNAYILHLYNPQTGKYVYVTMQKALYLLFENSVQYIP